MTGEEGAFGARLRTRRVAARLSQQELAERSGLSVRAISDLENGRTRQPYRNSVHRLADALDLSPADRRAFVAAAERRLGRASPAAAQTADDGVEVDGAALGEAALGEAAVDGRTPGDGPPARPVSVPLQLPAAVSGFVGRRDALAILSRAVDRSGATAVVAAIGGVAGVGKTALAVRWAHLLAPRFPDGQLYADLRGYDAGRPVSAAAVLARFLRALGVAGTDIPDGVDERAAAYRSLLAGRRMLVVLDNAGQAQQVRPLLPGAPGCLALVTSRDRLAGLVAREGAARVELDVLAPDEAAALLRGLIGARIDEDPDAAATLAERCCRLPLALRVAAELAAARPAVTIAELADELADLQHRLDLLDADGDGATAVRAVLSWSHRHLDSDTARAFCLLGLHPGPDIGLYAAAALIATGLRRAVRLLDRLARAHLIQDLGADRYGMHELLRAYAGELAAAELSTQDRRAALTGLYDHYLRTAAAAINTLFPIEAGRRPAVPAAQGPVPPVADPAAATAWLDAERANLTAAVPDMAAGGWPTHATRLSAVLFRYLDGDGHFPEAAVIHEHARRAAADSGDTSAEAAAVRNLGAIAFRLGRYEQAAEHFGRTLALFRETGDRRGEGSALHNLGTVERHRGRYLPAIEYFEQALALSRTLGVWLSEARALNGLGVMCTRLGRYAEAAGYLEMDLALFRAARDREGTYEILICCGEADALTNLGTIDMYRGRYQEAAERHRQAAALFDLATDPRGAVEALTNLGAVELRQGSYERAQERLRYAVARCREIGDRYCEADALGLLGRAALGRGEHAAALDLLHEALERSRQIGHRLGQAEAFQGLGEAFLAAGRPEQARDHHLQALALADPDGDVDLKARANQGLDDSRKAAADTGDFHTWVQGRRGRSGAESADNPCDVR